jgi:hypothetical protein
MAKKALSGLGKRSGGISFSDSTRFGYNNGVSDPILS